MDCVDAILHQDLVAKTGVLGELDHDAGFAHQVEDGENLAVRVDGYTIRA
jgi:hypothetical protein